jgi:hypothetical protein
VRCTIFALLLLLLVDLFHKLLDFLAPLGAATLGVMHQASLASLIVAERLMWVLDTLWAMAPTSRCSYSGGSIGQLLVLPTNLLLLLFAAALGSSIYVGLIHLPCL